MDQIPKSSEHCTPVKSSERPEDSGFVPLGETEGYAEDVLSQMNSVVLLVDHLQHVVSEAAALCDVLNVDKGVYDAIIRAARWHDLGKAHEVFQDTMQRGLGTHEAPKGALLAKTVKRCRHKRPYFRHELASALLNFAILSLHLRNAREKSGLSSQKHRDFRRFQHKNPYNVKILLLFREYGVKSSKKGGLQSFLSHLSPM